MAEKRRLWNAFQDLRAGRLSRRGFLQRAAALGVAAPIALSVLRLADVAAQEATPGAGAMDARPQRRRYERAVFDEVEPLPADSPVKHAGAADDASSGEGVAQAQP